MFGSKMPTILSGCRPLKMKGRDLMRRNRSRTLQKGDWFLAGLNALADGGPHLLQAAKVARMLGVTTGSFYWHFRSVENYQTELLEYWKDDVIVGLIHDARSTSEEPAKILADVRRRILESGAHRFDAAMREWARADPRVRETVVCADEIRRTFLAEMLSKSGLTEEEARDRASLIGAAWRGSVEDVDDPKYRMKLAGLAASA